MDVCVRQAKSSDCKEILRLIQELADFELMPNGPKLTEKGNLFSQVLFAMEISTWLRYSLLPSTSADRNRQSSAVQGIKLHKFQQLFYAVTPTAESFDHLCPILHDIGFLFMVDLDSF